MVMKYKVGDTFNNPKEYHIKVIKLLPDKMEYLMYFLRKYDKQIDIGYTFNASEEWIQKYYSQFYVKKRKDIPWL